MASHQATTSQWHPQAGVAGFHFGPSALGQLAAATYQGVLRPHASVNQGGPHKRSLLGKQAETDTVLHKWVVGPKSHHHAAQASDV